MMSAALAYRLVAAVDRLLGGDPMEPAPTPAPAPAPSVVEPPVAYDRCDALDESRPFDLDECPLCGGGGVYEVRDWMHAGELVWVECPSCRGGEGWVA